LIYDVKIRINSVLEFRLLLFLSLYFITQNRALAWLENKNMVTNQELAGAKDSLKWAARTYVAAAVGALASWMYYVLIYMGKK
jgi:Zn-dependent membrane protease YugP